MVKLIRVRRGRKIVQVAYGKLSWPSYSMRHWWFAPDPD